jgi:uncharacterized DUF497 family protein
MHNEAIRNSVSQGKKRSQQIKAPGHQPFRNRAGFYDERALTLQDHHHDEQRWIIRGMDAKGRLLVVAYTYRDPNFVRIISARIATKNERRRYMED